MESALALPADAPRGGEIRRREVPADDVQSPRRRPGQPRATVADGRHVTRAERAGDESETHMSMNTRRRKKACTRRAFLSVAVAAPALFVGSPRAGAAANGDVKVSSPDGRVRFELVGRGAARLGFRVTLREKPVIETSPLGIVIDGVDLSEGAEVVRVETYRVREKYPWRGVHSEAIDHCHGARVFLAHAATKTAYTVEARAYNDGVAFRHVVPGEGKQRVPDEATAFKVPAGSVVWFHDFEGHYEGVHARRGVAEVKAGEWAAPPLTVKLPGGAGYASITEAALVNYAGMGLRADGARGFRAVLGHALPISYPFKLRYGDEEGKRLSNAAAIEGTITTPWRVVL